MSNGREHIERVREQLKEEPSYTQAVMMFTDVSLTLYDAISENAATNEEIERRVDDTESRLDVIETRVLSAIGITVVAAIVGLASIFLG